VTPEEAVLTSGAAWTATDDEKRLALLEQSWAPDGVFHDPQGRVEGREALAKHIAGFQQAMVGHRIDATTGVQAYDDRYLRFGWKMYGPDGNELLEGVDFGEFDEDGRIKLIVGFWGPWPELGTEART
jgi:hypothetical protein